MHLIIQSLYYALMFVFAASLAIVAGFTLIFGAAAVVCIVLVMVLAAAAIVLCHDCCSWALVKLGIWDEEE